MSAVPPVPNSPDTDERFIRLESLVAELEHMVEQLNATVVEQGKALKKLHAQQLNVAETIETLELERIRATNPKPPHSVI